MFFLVSRQAWDAGETLSTFSSSPFLTTPGRTTRLATRWERSPVRTSSSLVTVVPDHACARSSTEKTCRLWFRLLTLASRFQLDRSRQFVSRILWCQNVTMFVSVNLMSFILLAGTQMAAFHCLSLSRNTEVLPTVCWDQYERYHVTSSGSNTRRWPSVVCEPYSDLTTPNGLLDELWISTSTCNRCVCVVVIS